MTNILDIILRRGKSKKEKKKEKDNLIEYIRKISFCTHSRNSLNDEIEGVEYKNITENDSEYFIPLVSFFKLIEVEKMDVNHILDSCVHISEIKTDDFSCVEAYPVARDNHIALYSDEAECKKDTGYVGDKITLVTWRKR